MSVRIIKLGVAGMSMMMASVLLFGSASTPVLKADSEAKADDSKASLVWRVDVQNFGDDERLAAVCLQGLANRGSARVFLDYGSSLRWLQFDYDRDNGDKGGRNWSEADAARLKEKYRSVCDYWIDFYQNRGICRFETVTMPELIRKLRGELKGVILFNSVPDDLSIAATMSGLSDAVPLTQALYEDWIAGGETKLPVIFDIRSLYGKYVNGENRRLAAHRWMLDNLYFKCDKSGAVSRDRTYGQAAHDTLVDIDLAVSRRWVSFDLSFMSSEIRKEGDKDKPDPVWGFDPPDKQLLIEILDLLDDWAPVYGWGRPNESALIRRLAMHRCVKICGGTGNASFYRYMPRLCPDFKQPEQNVEKIDCEKKFYVAFMTNEGDTLKCASSLVNGGSWLQSERGKLPINWGVDPLLIRDTPGLMSYYYSTATDNDYFFSAPSGWGYLAPETLPENQIGKYGSMVKMGADMSDTRYIDVWWMAGLRKRNQFFPLLQAMGMRGLTQWSSRQEVEFAPEGTPVIHSNYYYPRFRPEVFADKLIAESDEVKPPWFIVVYGGGPHWFSQVAERLPKDRFKVVKLDEFFEAARQARPQLEGRTWFPPKDTPKP